MTEEDIARVSATFPFSEGAIEDVKGYCAAVTTEEIAISLHRGVMSALRSRRTTGSPLMKKAMCKICTCKF